MDWKIKNPEKIIKAETDYEYRHSRREQPWKNQHAQQRAQAHNPGYHFKKSVQGFFFRIFDIRCFWDIEIFAFLHSAPNRIWTDVTRMKISRTGPGYTMGAFIFDITLKIEFFQVLRYKR